MNLRLLLASEDPGFGRALGDTLSRDAEVIRRRPEEAASPGGGEVDGVVCTVDHAGQLDILARLRDAFPAAPIVVLSGRNDAGFLEDVRRCGGDAAYLRREPAQLASLVLSTVETLQACRQSQALIRESRHLHEDLLRIGRRRRALLQQARELTAPPPPILMAEDDDLAALLLERSVGLKGGGPVRRVVDGLEAVHYLSGEDGYADRERHPLPGLLVLDVHMPRMNGLEALRWAKARPETRRIPAVFLTFLEEPEVVAEAYASGADAYLVKPMSYQGMLRTAELIRDYWRLATSSAL